MNLATTGVGSLPFETAAGAVRHAVRAYDLPFCPQLPVHDGDMIAWGVVDPLAPDDVGVVAARVRACLAATGAAVSADVR